MIVAFFFILGDLGEDFIGESFLDEVLYIDLLDCISGLRETSDFLEDELP